MHNYFSVLNIAPAFDIDQAELQKRYFDAQRSFHPDKMMGKSAAERQQSIHQSILANEAYDVLKLPLSRARHLLALQGIEVGGDKDTFKPSHTLLMEVMEEREALMEAGTLAEVQAFEMRHIKAREDLMAELSAAFASSAWEEAANLTLRLNYLVKLEDEIRIRKKRLAA